MARTPKGNKIGEFKISDTLTISLHEIDALDVTEGSVQTVNVEGQDRLQWKGKGVFDTIMTALDENLRVEYDNGRILGPDYAGVYSRMVEIALDQSIKLLMMGEELKMKAIEAKLKADQMKAETELIPLKQENLRAQTKVYERQIEGFSDNLKLKLLEAQLNAFSMIYASGMLDFDQTNEAFPSALKATNLTEAYGLVKNAATLDWLAQDKYKVEERIKRGGTTSPIKL